MKKLITPAILVGLLAFSTGFVLIKNQNYQQVDAYTVSSVPTTIVLKDNTESEIRNYYSSLNSLSENERLGTNLLKNLKPILKNGQKYFSYGSSATRAVWQAYEIVDRDWEKSPASEVSGYNASTNTITGYVYGKSNSDVGTNPYIHALYVNRDVDNQQKAWGNHDQVQWGINQEHIWAKSCGFENDTPAAGARGDLMHLWAGNGRVNGNTHSNYYYGFVDTTKSYNDAGDYASTLSGNLRGYSETLGGSVTVFEPQDSDKGDIARAIFYMAARYNYLSGSDSDGIDAGNPNLEIVNDVTSWQSSGYQSSTTKTGKMGILQDLLAWNRLDPPDEWETHRNNLLYNNFTNNRNPFIDFPEWADAIWGTADLDGKNYDPTPTKAANPLTDGIGGAVVNEPFDVSIDNLELKAGQEGKVSGHNADDDILWSVDDDTVVSLSKDTSHNNEEITVTALKDGSTVIRASAFSNGDLINKSINVKVSEDVVVLVGSISVSGAKTEFQVGDTFSSEGLVVTATYNNGTTEVVSSGYTVSSPDMSKEGKQTVTVTYEGKTATYEINVVKPAEEAKEPNFMLFVIVGAVALVLIIIIVIIVYANASKKGKKKMRSLAKKGVKKAIKNSKKNSR